MKPYELVKQLEKIYFEQFKIMEQKETCIDNHIVEIPFREFCEIYHNAEKIEGTQKAPVIKFNSGKIKCTHCGVVLDAVYNYCPQCGDILEVKKGE